MALDVAKAVSGLRGLTAKFDLGVTSATPFYPELCTIAPSEGYDEQYGFLGAMPGMREWVGDRVFNELRGGHYTIVNKEWESSLIIQREALEDDRIRVYDNPIEQLAIEAAHHPDELLQSLIAAAESDVGWDGQYYFDTDHSWGDSGAQSNDLTYSAANPDAVTLTEFHAAFEQARIKLLGYKNDQGKLFNRPNVVGLNKLLCYVPIQLQETATKVFNSLVLNGSSNIVVDKPRLVASAALTSARKFYVFNLAHAIKPFIFQARRPLTRQIKGVNDREFKDVKFMTDARYNLGYGPWWNSVLTTFTA